MTFARGLCASSRSNAAILACKRAAFGGDFRPAWQRHILRHGFHVKSMGTLCFSGKIGEQQEQRMVRAARTGTA